MRLTTLALCTAISTASETTLSINVGTQGGFFQTGSDISSLNPHDYRPNEFVTNDFIYEGLTEWDGEHTEGVDGVSGTDDDYVKPSLASGWTTNYDAVVADDTAKYEITFTLQSGVTFHDGSPWNAEACKGNFDQIMGGTGESGGAKAMRGMHDWLGFTQSLDGWSIVDDMTFKLTFTTYYEAALRELTYIRPFRMISLASLPNMSAMELSHNAWRKGAPRVFGGYTMRSVSNPIGTGPYKVVNKVLHNAQGQSRILPAAEFNASCYTLDTCTYEDGEYVAEVLFQKVAGHRKNPSYDNIVLKSYASVTAVKEALQAGTLDVAYGVQTLSPSAFLSLATAEEGADVIAHKASSDLNTRLLVLNSGGRLNTPDLRKLVMGVLAASRQALYDGELSEEEPMDTLFDPALPHCSVLSTLSSSEDLAATKAAGVTASDITQPLRFLYIKDIPHARMIAASVIAALYEAGIPVEPIPVAKDEYNSYHCNYLSDPDSGFPYYYSYSPYSDTEYHSWDLAYSETWGPPYDATSKLWDMTHGVISGWCSGEADAPAVSNMASMDVATFSDKVRSLSTTIDKTAREALYSEVLTTLHDEAIFLPITAKRQTAVTNARVSGFQFGYMEFDFPLANLHPTVDPNEVSYTSCGVTHTVSAPPTKVVTMNQGVTEFMLAMGLEEHMAGTAYLDDAIWPKYATAYASIPVLSEGYPTEAEIMAVSPDFILGSYKSAFKERTCDADDADDCSGVFSDASVGPCAGTGSEWEGSSYNTCRPQLHAAGIGSWLEPVSCEDSSLTPQGGASEETVYSAIRQIGRIFNVNTIAEQLISEIRNDFAIAEQTLASSGHQLNAVWLDCVTCCKDDDGNPTGELFVGGGTGAPNLIMEEAGLTNVFGAEDGSWVCVTVAQIMDANVDVMVVVDASWDSAISKIEYLHDHAEFCEADFVKQADYITIPFSASTLGPRNGAAAIDMVAAAVHVTTGDVMMDFQSGVKFLDPDVLKTATASLRCPLNLEDVVYSEEGAAALSESSDSLPDYAKALIAVFCVLFVAFFLCACVMYMREKQGKPIFHSLDTVNVSSTGTAKATASASS